MRLYLTYEKRTEGFDGDLFTDTHNTHISNEQTHTITQSIYTIQLMVN